jgi:hypothetical protein
MMSMIYRPTKPSITWRCKVFSLRICGRLPDTISRRIDTSTFLGNFVVAFMPPRNSEDHVRTFKYSCPYCRVIAKSSAGGTDGPTDVLVPVFGRPPTVDFPDFDRLTAPDPGFGPFLDLLEFDLTGSIFTEIDFD